MSSSILVLPSLGRPFTLGALYDARRDKLIPGFTLWEDEVLEENTVNSPLPSSAFEIIASDSIDDKSSLMHVEASLKASFLGGLIEVGGSAKYLNDTKEYKNQSRVTLQYKVTTNFKQLMTNLGTKHIEYSDLFENIQATHVVMAILYGANAFFVFDSDKVDSSSVQEIQGNMEAAIKKIPSVEISGQGDVKLTDGESAVINNFSCKFHGDMFLPCNPTTFEDAVKTYQQLPQMLGKENTVPMTVWLMPLTSFYPEVPKMVADCTAPVLRKARNFLESIRQLEMRCNDSLGENIVKLFPQIKQKLSSFQKLCNSYMLKLRNNIAKKLLALRSGEEDESSLIKIFEDNLRSPFNIDSLNMWLEYEEREINVVRSCMDIIQEAKPKVVLSKGVMVKELLDSKVKHALCFVFTSMTEEDYYLKDLRKYSDSPERYAIPSKRFGKPLKLRPREKDYWFLSDSLAEMMRQSAYLFTNLAKEMNNRTVRFLATSQENPKQEGAGIHYYKEGILIFNEFHGPVMFDVESIQYRADLQWYDCELTLDPDTAHPALILSDDNKTVASGKAQSYPDSPERFERYQQVLCKEGLSGRHYWEVEWSGYVRAGVTYRGINRKTRLEEGLLGQSEKSWCFDYYPSSGYNHIHNTKKVSVPVSFPGFERLGVYLDWPAGTLSFYRVRTELVSHIHTFHTKFHEAVYPGFMVGFTGVIRNGQVKLL